MLLTAWLVLTAGRRAVQTVLQTPRDPSRPAAVVCRNCSMTCQLTPWHATACSTLNYSSAEVTGNRRLAPPSQHRKAAVPYLDSAYMQWHCQTQMVLAPFTSANLSSPVRIQRLQMLIRTTGHRSRCCIKSRLGAPWRSTPACWPQCWRTI